MAYAVRHVRTSHKSQGGEDFTVATAVVYAESPQAALELGSLKLGVPESMLVVDQIEDTMGEQQADSARELYPGQNEDAGMVANITDEMRGAAQSKVYGKG